MNCDIKNQEPFVQRMITEQDELNERINKCKVFINSNKFKTLKLSQKFLLKKQLKIMINYFKILDRRINLEGIL